MFGGFGIGNTSCVEAARESKVPILLIHGEADAFVPTAMGRERAENNPLVELHTFPDATHGICYITDKERYISVLKEFLNKNKGMKF